jgi:hypothetical protein
MATKKAAKRGKKLTAKKLEPTKPLRIWTK